jgi:hypothetical protein
MDAFSSLPGSPSRRWPWRKPRRAWVWLALSISLIGLLAVGGRQPLQTYTIELGPFTLPSGSGHDSIEQPRPLTVSLPVDGWMRGLSYELVDENGDEVPGRVLHHLNLIARGRRELFSSIMLRVGAFGPETKALQIPFFLGYRLRPGDSLLVTAMLHNPTPKAYRGTRLRVRIAFTPSSSWLRPVSIQPVYLDVMPPAGHHAFDLPPGRSTRSWEGRPAIPARLIAAAGHLHKYGTGLRLEDVTRGELLWESLPETNGQGEVEGMPVRYFPPLGIQLRPDHVYRLTATYNNPTGAMLPGGGMGALGGIVIPARGSVWPSPVRADPVHQYDVWLTAGPGAHHRRPMAGHTH